MGDLAIRERQGSTGILTMNRPDRRNALSRNLMLELIDELKGLGADPEVRAVILAAEGSAFSAGHDLSEMVNCSEAGHRSFFQVCVDLMETIQGLSQPVIAEVRGVATAAGCQLAATCDLVVAAENASFATPGVKIGLFCTTPMVALTRAIGSKRAMEMLLLGDAISARTAAEWGLVNWVVPGDELRATTLQIAERIAEASSCTVGIGKRAFYAQIGMEQRGAYEHAREVMTSNAQLPDAQEGMSAFLEKRKPRWTER